MHSAVPQATCTINGCGTRNIGRKYSIDRHVKRHIDGKIKGPTGPSAGGILAYAAPQQKQNALPSLPAGMTAMAAVKEAQNGAAAMMFAAGLSANTIASLNGPLVDAVLACKNLQSGRTILRVEDGSLDTVVKSKLLPYLKSLIMGMHVVISVDKKDQDMAGGKGLIHIMLTAATLKAPILADAVIVPFGTTQDADYYVKLVEKVLVDWGIPRKDIIGISVDNTSLNPAFVSKMKLTLLPCVTHVINLMYCAADNVFNLDMLYGWRDYFARSYKRRDAATAAGLPYRPTQVAGTRFGASSAFLGLLSDPDMFKRFATFARAHPVAAYVKAQNKVKKATVSTKSKGRNEGKGTATTGVKGGVTEPPAVGSARSANGIALALQAAEASSYSTLLANMEDAYTQACIVVVHAITNDASALLTASQCDVRHMPFDFWESWDDWGIFREVWFNDTSSMITALLTEKNIELDAAGLKQLENCTVVALETMDKKVDDHIMTTAESEVSNGVDGES